MRSHHNYCLTNQQGKRGKRERIVVSNIFDCKVAGPYKIATK
jgi:hypothetical protein